MKRKLLIFGKGFIGSRVHQNLHCDVTVKKIYSYEDAEAEIKKYKPAVIMNCVGETGERDVDDCELDKNKTLYCNSFFPLILAEAALRHNLKLIHVGSGCIYHYDYAIDKPILENKIPDYFNLFYSRSKIYSERALELLSSQHNVLIVRLRIPLDNQPHPRNILTKLIDYKKVINLPNSLTYIPDFLKALKHLISIDARGTYNVVNTGSLRYPHLLKVYKKYVPEFKFKTVDYKKLKLVRTNLILSTKKLERSGFKIRNINSVLEECVKQYLQY